MRILRRLLHLDDDPVSDDDRADLEQLRAVTAEGRDRADTQTTEAHRLARFFTGQNERNHLAERLGAALRGR